MESATIIVSTVLIEDGFIQGCRAVVDDHAATGRTESGCGVGFKQTPFQDHLRRLRIETGAVVIGGIRGEDAVLEIC